MLNDLLTVSAQTSMLVRHSVIKRAHSFVVRSRVAWVASLGRDLHVRPMCKKKLTFD